MPRLCPVVLLLAAGSAIAQPLYSLSFNGQLHVLNTTNGAATLIGATGFTRLNSGAMSPSGQIYTNHARDTTVGGDGNKLISVDPVTGAGTLIVDWGTVNDIRGLAFVGSTLYGIRDGAPDALVTIDTTTGAVTLVGSTGNSNLQGLASTPSGELYGVVVLSPAGGLFKIDTATGLATAVAGVVGADNQALEWSSGTVMYAARANLVTVDYVSGTVTNIGPTGLSDIRGLARAFPVITPPCYANCDNSTTPPILNVQDFSCFLNLFASGDSYANCDNSTTAPVLNVQDFSCFLNAFANGCT